MVKAFQNVCSSSFRTLVATGMMAAAERLKGRTDYENAEISGRLAGARDEILARGKSALGEKTVLDGLDAQGTALGSLQEGQAALDSAIAAARETVETFRDKKNLTGRARIFGDKSIGLPDPGQLALVVMTEGLGR